MRDALLDRITEVESEIRKLDTQKHQAEGELIAARKQLKENGFQTEEQARKELVGLKREIDKKEKELKQLEKDLEELMYEIKGNR